LDTEDIKTWTLGKLEQAIGVHLALMEHQLSPTRKNNLLDNIKILTTLSKTKVLDWLTIQQASSNTRDHMVLYYNNLLAKAYYRANLPNAYVPVFQQN
jgi:hypothetical protein